MRRPMGLEMLSDRDYVTEIIIFWSTGDTAWMNVVSLSSNNKHAQVQIIKQLIAVD
jgi:hypothetical protein